MSARAKNKKIKSVRMSVDFSSTDIEDQPTSSQQIPEISFQEYCSDSNGFNQVPNKYPYPDLDPELLAVASRFVEDLIFRAKVEAHNRSMVDNDNLDTDALLSNKAQKRPQLESYSSMDGNLRHIREEINKKCRRVYRVFLSCYGKLP